MFAQAQKQNYKTIEEYFELEINSEERHEYLDGEIVVMAGGSLNHNQIVLNLGDSLNFALKRQPYRVSVSDQRLWIPQKRRLSSINGVKCSLRYVLPSDPIWTFN